MEINNLKNLQETISYISKNTQNINTTAFKGSEAYLISDKNGNVAIEGIKHNFSQGALQASESPLHAAVNGNGYFIINKKNGDTKYSRDGLFILDKNNDLVNTRHDYVVGTLADEKGNIAHTSDLHSLKKINVPKRINEPKKTENVKIALQLPALQKASSAKAINEFNPDDVNTFNFSTTNVIYDSLGKSYKLKSYYLKPGIRSKLYNTQTRALDKEISQEVMVDCSHVEASDQRDTRGFEGNLNDSRNLQGTFAWAVFHSINGRPLQPLNEKNSDIQGFQYQAKNLKYVDDDGVTHDNLTTANTIDNSKAKFINISNNNKATGKIYPNTNPEDVISGDKNKLRPKDYWRCEFLFIDSSNQVVTQPLKKNIFQPLGRTGHVAGDIDQPPVDIELISYVDQEDPDIMPTEEDFISIDPPKKEREEVQGISVNIQPSPLKKDFANLAITDFTSPAAGEFSTLKITVKPSSSLDKPIVFLMQVDAGIINSRQLIKKIEHTIMEAEGENIDAQKLFEKEGLLIKAHSTKSEIEFLQPRNSKKYKGIELEFSKPDFYPVTNKQIKKDIGSFKISNIVAAKPNTYSYEIKNKKNTHTLKYWLELRFNGKKMKTTVSNDIIGKYFNQNKSSISVFKENIDKENSKTKTQFADYLKDKLNIMLEQTEHPLRPKESLSNYFEFTSSVIPHIGEPEIKLKTNEWLFDESIDISMNIYNEELTKNDTPYNESRIKTPEDDKHTANKEARSFQVTVGGHNFIASKPIANLDENPINILSINSEGLKQMNKRSHFKLKYINNDKETIHKSGLKDYRSQSSLESLSRSKRNIASPSASVSGFSAGLADPTNISSLLSPGGYSDLGIDVISYSANQNQKISIDFTGSMTIGEEFKVISQQADGVGVGVITRLDIEKDGTLKAYYDNNMHKTIAKLNLATFNDESGLINAGSNYKEESHNSGKAFIKTAGDNNTGTIENFSLERSNVDMADSILKLIEYSQLFTTNTKATKVQNDSFDEIRNIM